MIDIIKNSNENKDIRSEAIVTLAQTLPNFSYDIKEEKIIPVLQFLITYKTDIDIVIVITKQLGPLVYHLEKEIDLKGINQQVMNYIYEQIDHPNEEIRQNIIFNYPCFFQLFGEKQKDKLLKLYINALTKDSQLKVRLQAIKILPELVKFLGIEDTKNQLKQPIKQILAEKDNNQIRIELAKKLPSILEHLQSAQNKLQQAHASAAPSLANITSQKGVGEILNCIESNTKSPCWRLVKQLLEIFQQTLNTFNFSDIQEKFSNMLFKCFQESNFEVKKVAAHNLVSLIVQQKLVPNRDQKLYSARNFHLRIIYLEIVEECILKFSRQFFKQYNLIQCLQLYSDKVPNVRRKLASLIVKIRNSLFKEDTESIENFDSLIIHLLSDDDNETAKIAQQQHSNLKDIDSFQSSQDIEEGEKDLDIQDLMENDEENTNDNQFRSNYRSYQEIDKNSSSLQYQSNLLPSNKLAKRKNINIKKIPSLCNTKSSSTPKNQSLTPISNKVNLKNGGANNIISFKQQLQLSTTNSRKNSSNSENTNGSDKLTSSQNFVLSQKTLNTLTPISSQQSSGSLLKSSSHLSTILNAQPLSSSFNSNTLQTKVNLQQEYIFQRNQQRSSTLIDQNEGIYNLKERASASLNKYNNLKPLQSSKNQHKISPFSPSLNSSIQTSSNVYTNNINEKKLILERKDTFENYPQLAQESKNLYRIKKQFPISSGLPPKFQIKKKF